MSSKMHLVPTSGLTVMRLATSQNAALAVQPACVVQTGIHVTTAHRGWSSRETHDAVTALRGLGVDLTSFVSAKALEGYARRVLAERAINLNQVDYAQIWNNRNAAFLSSSL